MQISRKSRIEWIDVAKGYGILAVVMGHCFNKGSLIHNWIFSFHMPLFYLLSGYCFNLEKYTDIKELAKSKGKSLLIPYIKFCMLGLLVSILIPEWRNGIRISHILVDLYNGYPASVNLTSTWFLISLFVCECIFFILVKGAAFFENKYIMYGGICAAGFMGYLVSVIKSVVYDPLHEMQGLNHVTFSVKRLPLTMDTCMTAIVFFACGYCLKHCGKNIEKENSMAVGVVLLCVNVVFGVFLNTRVNLHACTLGNGLYFYIAAFAGSGFVICFSKWICSGKNRRFFKMTADFLKFYGRNSLLMLGMQSLGIHLYVYLINNSTGSGYILYETLSWQYGVVAFLLLLAVFLPITCWINSRLSDFIRI